MKLKVFYATDGDCLLLTSSDGHHALIDGGRTKSFREQTWATLQELAREEQALDWSWSATSTPTTSPGSCGCSR